MKACDKCKGTGLEGITTTANCLKCGGTGREPESVTPYCPHAPCGKCKELQHTINIKVPALEVALVLQGEKLAAIASAVREWRDKQGHDACWYYPEIFERIAKMLNIEGPLAPIAVPRDEFRNGCQKFEEQVYKDSVQLMKDGLTRGDCLSS